MDSTRWQRLDELFAAALAVPDGERRELLAGLCADDAELRREVESLLASHREGGFLDRPGTEWAGELVAGSGAEPQNGRQLGRFFVLGKLGAGGMGEVYLAHDPLLQRRLALKLLPAALADDADWIARLRREALAASALNHPNLLTVHEIADAGGSELLVSEVVDGVTLRQRLSAGPLPVEEALGLVLQICRGLAAAHAAGLVHRDVKPDNVMVRRDGLVKLLDFGIAESLQAAAGDAARPPAARSGTLGYMSPEQERGLPVEPRSDVWSVGIVLHELLTGRRPTAGPQQSPRPSTRRSQVPAPVEGLLRRMLAEQAADRPDAAQVGAEIERLLAGRAGSGRRTLAASLLAGLAVAAIALPLLRSTMAPRPSPPAPATRRAPDPAANALYLRGRALWSRRTIAAMHEAVGYFEQATAKDPGFAPAYALLADARLVLAGTGEDPHRQRMLARAAVEKALELDPTLPGPHAVLALEAQNYDYDWERAEREYRRAIALAPGDATAWHRLGEMLALLGRFDEGIALLEHARAIDPASPIIGADLAKALWFARRFDDAERVAREVLARWPDFAQASLFRAASLAFMARSDEACAELDRFLAADSSPAARTVAGTVFAAAGDARRARALLDETLGASDRGEAVDPASVAGMLVGLGRRDAAMDWLERGYREGSILLGIGVHPVFDPLHDEPRFRALCARLRLPPPTATVPAR